MTSTPHRLRAAHVQRAHGVRGELRVEPLGGDAGRFTPGLLLEREPDGPVYTVASARGLPDGEVLLRLVEITDRTAADLLRGAYLCVDAERARALPEGEWFVHELVGLSARTPEGVEVGEVVDLEAYREQDVLVVRDRDGGLRRMPLVSAFVRQVDPQRGVIVVTPWAEDR